MRATGVALWLITVLFATASQRLPQTLQPVQVALADGPANVTPESVIGTDNRRVIEDTGTLPWRAVCRLSIANVDGSKTTASGVLISKRVVLTAGHAVYASKRAGWAKSGTVAPGYSRGSPLGEHQIERMAAPLEWIRDGNSDYDYGVAILAKPANDAIICRGYPSPQRVLGLMTHTAGYPGDLADGERLYYARGPIEKVTEFRLYYRTATAGGQSGSPVWQRLCADEEGREDERYVIGVHSGYDARQKLNYAVRLTPERIEWLNGYIEKYR